MNDQDILARWEGYRLLVEALTTRAVSGEFAAVSEELGGLDVQMYSDERGIGFPPPLSIARLAIHHKYIMEAIAEKIIPDGWEYEVRVAMMGAPQIVLLSFTQRYLGSQP